MESMDPWKWIVVTLVGFIAVVVLGFGLIAASKSFHRYQKRADAKNQVQIYNIQIQQQAQRVQIAKQDAEIRKQTAIGVREAQDEIAATLTPLYVQFEMTEALKQIATSGSNNSTVFIPAGAAGIPLISNANPTKVTKP
jgi:leucyl aminopeptidase